MCHALLAAALLIPALNVAAPPAAPTTAAALWPDLKPFYEDLHAHPELSFQETSTAAKFAERLRALGYEVTTGVGKTGVVGILKNGAGPTVMLRTELDALPVEEKTGLPYASKATATDPNGATVSVMHACGHDVHMTVSIGAATLLSRSRGTWKGTLMIVGQPAEEVGGGAKAMLDAGLFTRFPRPDAALAVHDSDVLPAGVVAVKAGPLYASADSVDIVVHGKGGHGGRPQMTVDPVVIAAKIVLGLQTLVSRENDPFDPAVVTVGAIHGGTKHNIIPDEVRMQLSVRAFKPEVRKRLLDGIERIARAEGEAAGAPKPPDVTVSDSTPPTSNDDALEKRVEPALRKALGDARVREAVAITAAEDFSMYGEAGVPILMMWIGAVDPDVLARAKRDGTVLPGLHSSLFAPVPEPTVTTGIETLVAAAKEEFSRAR
jgi:amidohydrolase